MKKVKVWDISVRLFHWALVIAFALSGYSAFQDKYAEYADIHLWSGFAILVLVGWRILWGLWGSETARFSSFIKSPRAALAYGKKLFKREAEPHVGHNPLGGYSVALMLLLLLTQAILGLFSSDDMFFSGPFAESIGSTANIVTDIHEILGFTLFGLVGLHIGAVLFYAVVKRFNLVLPMITGWMMSAKQSTPTLRSPLLALLFLLLVGAGCYQLIFGF